LTVLILSVFSFFISYYIILGIEASAFTHSVTTLLCFMLDPTTADLSFQHLLGFEIQLLLACTEALLIADKLFTETPSGDDNVMYLCGARSGSTTRANVTHMFSTSTS